MEIQEKQRKNKNKKKRSSKFGNKNNKTASNYENEKLFKEDFTSQGSVDVCLPKTSTTNCNKKQKKLSKKSKKRNLPAENHETSTTQNVPTEKKSRGKNKNKKKKNMEVQENAVVSQNQIDSSQTKSNKHIKKKKNETEMIDKEKSVEVTSKVQRVSPNATKFMLINLIKQVLQKQKDLSKNKLQKKVLRKYCKVMGVDEKPELVKHYEKSLLLTYGIEILNDTVRLKQ